MAKADWPVHGEITGPIVMIGFGSIGRGTLPLIERHFKYDKSRLVVIDPSDANKKLLDERGIRFIQEAVTKENYKTLLKPLLTEGGGQGFCVNLSVDTSSVDISASVAARPARSISTRSSNLGPASIMPTTSITPTAPIMRCARLCLPNGRSTPAARPRCPAAAPIPAWSRGSSSRPCLTLPATCTSITRSLAATIARAGRRLMKKAGVKGIHIAERDTQRAGEPKPFGAFWNTWSVDGFISEGLQPAELGWGTHEKWMPKNARKQKKGNKAAIFLEQPGADTRIRTWCPTEGAQFGLLVTHNEAISIADFFTVFDKKGKANYRPTCHYAYHPANVATLSLDEMFGAAGQPQAIQHVLDEFGNRRRCR